MRVKSRRSQKATILFGLIVLGVGGCDSLGPDGRGGPGTFTVTLVSPHGNEGSAVFELVGGIGLGTVSPVGGEVFYQHFGGSTRVVVVMDDPGEVGFRLRTEEVRENPEVSLLQVASGEDELRSSLSGYTIRIEGERDPSAKGGR